jgi:PhzF family phenazine biosynthesis protein
MRLDLYQVDAFASRVFEGNPAAVCPLEAWLPEPLMQQIAGENNLSETAFFVADPTRPGHYALRWFTPTSEVDLCGHATLGAAFVIRRFLKVTVPLSFETRSGFLGVTGEGDRLVLDFPALPIAPARHVPEALIRGLGHPPENVLASGEAGGSGFWVGVYTTESEVRSLTPDLALLSTLGRMGVVATSPGDDSDLASRCFAPTFGIPEDPVTGSIHCFLVPYWAERTGREKLRARQVSRRGGELDCELAGDRVRIGGRAVCFMRGTIEVPET